MMKEQQREAVKCPICGKMFTDVPALSRVDNETLICPDCGIREALGSIGVAPEEQERILRIIHQTRTVN